MLLSIFVFAAQLATAAHDVPTLACDKTYGCMIATPPFDPIANALSTDSRIELHVLANGATAAGAIKVVPQSDVGAEVDVTLQDQVCRVAIKVIDTLQSNLFTCPAPPTLQVPAIASPPPQPVAQRNRDATEAAALNPSDLDFGYASTGTRPCVAAFAVVSRRQVWCRFHDDTIGAPVAFVQEGRDEVPVGARLLRDHYYVIDDTITPIILHWVDGATTTITRTHE